MTWNFPWGCSGQDSEVSKQGAWVRVSITSDSGDCCSHKDEPENLTVFKALRFGHLTCCAFWEKNPNTKLEEFKWLEQKAFFNVLSTVELDF